MVEFGLMSVDTETLSVSALAYRMLHAPLFIEAVSSGDRLSEAQSVRMTVGVRGHVEAAVYSAAWLRAEFVDGRHAILTVFFVFIIAPLCTQDCYHPGLFSLKGPRWIADVNHPSVYGWRAALSRRGKRCKLKVT